MGEARCGRVLSPQQYMLDVNKSDLSVSCQVSKIMSFIGQTQTYTTSIHILITDKSVSFNLSDKCLDSASLQLASQLPRRNRWPTTFEIEHLKRVTPPTFLDKSSVSSSLGHHRESLRKQCIRKDLIFLTLPPCRHLHTSIDLHQHPT